MLKKVTNTYFSSEKRFFLREIIIIFFILLTVIARFVWLNQFPVGLDADSVEVVLSTKTLGEYGLDSSGTSWRNTLFGNNTKSGIAALPSLLLSPMQQVLNLNLLNMRVIFTLLNILTTLFIALFVYEFKKDRLLFLIALFVSLINPWLFSYSRIPTEAPFSLLFLMIGLYLFVKNSGKKMFYALPFFVIAFYSYFGSKPILLLLIPVIVLIKYIHTSNHNLKKYILFTFIFLVFSVLYFYVSLTSNYNTLTRRGVEEILLLNPDKFSTAVDEYRRSSINYPYKNLIINKYTFTALEFTKKYTSWISSDLLFWSGDLRGMYTFQNHGLFYLVDLVFIILGIYYLNNNKYLSRILLTLFLIAPLPSALSNNGDSIFYRGYLLILALIILISWGLYNLTKKTNDKYLLLIIFIYMFLFINFLLFYFFRYPIKQHSNNFVEGRVIANYILRSKSNVTILTTSPYAITNELMFYNNIVDKSSLSIAKDEYYINDTLITNKCLKYFGNELYIIDTRLNCNLPKRNYLAIQNQSDSGVTFKIFSDKLCDTDTLNQYRRDHLISDYNIEKMSDTEFCNRWIQKYEKN